MAWRLEIKRGSKIESFVMTLGSYTIGRSGCYINLDDKKVSKTHCTIYINGQQAILIDNDSSNGTFINGTKVSNKELVHLDDIVLGMTKLKVVKFEDNS